MHPYKGDSVACGNFIVYKLTDDNKEYTSVKVDITSLDLVGSQSFGIGKSEVVQVKRKKFDAPINETLCNDLMPAVFPKTLLEEVATDGIVEIIVSETDQENAKNRKPYRATVILKNVVFESQSIDYLRLDNIYVGWLPG